MSGDFGPSWWTNGMSDVATGGGGSNIDFCGNWAAYNAKQQAAYQSDLAMFNGMLTGSKGDPGAAIIFFAMVLGQDMMNQTGNQVNETSDQSADVANISRAIAKLKQIFQQANGVIPGSAQDQQLTQEFNQDLGQLNLYLTQDGWAQTSGVAGGASLFSSIQPTIQSFQELLKSDGSLATIWAKAGSTINPNITSSPVDPNDPNGPITIVVSGCPQGLQQEIQAIVGSGAGAYGYNYDPNTETLTITGFTGQNQQVAMAGIQTAIKAYNDNNPPTPDSSDLKTILNGFDVMSSSAATLSSVYQGQLQYLTSTFNQMANLIHGIQNDINQQDTSIQNNTRSS